jgi:hypothetical protein
MRNFIEEFKKKCRELDNPEPPKPRYQEPADEPAEPRYDIRRVVLPGGQTDTVAFNLTRANVEWWLNHQKRFKTKHLKSPIEEIPPIVFFEPVAQDASDEERSIYYNKRPVITDEDAR